MRCTKANNKVLRWLEAENASVIYFVKTLFIHVHHQFRDKSKESCKVKICIVFKCHWNIQFYISRFIYKESPKRSALCQGWVFFSIVYVPSRFVNTLWKLFKFFVKSAVVFVHFVIIYSKIKPHSLILLSHHTFE